MQIYINDILFVKTAMCNLVEQNSWLLCLIPRLSNTNNALGWWLEADAKPKHQYVINWEWD